MAIKVYKSTTTARTVQYQDSLLAPVVPGWPDVPTFIDDDRINMFRPTTRQTKDDAYGASIACLADNETDLTAIVGAAKLRGCDIHSVEEGLTINKSMKLPEIKRAWKEARKAGAAMRGARISADTKKAKTAAALKLIEHELKATDIPTTELLARVGVKSINSIKNTYGISREQMKIRYEAELKRKARRKANAGNI